MFIDMLRGEVSKMDAKYAQAAKGTDIELSAALNQLSMVELEKETLQDEFNALQVCHKLLRTKTKRNPTSPLASF